MSLLCARNQQTAKTTAVAVLSALELTQFEILLCVHEIEGIIEQFAYLLFVPEVTVEVKSLTPVSLLLRLDFFGACKLSTQWLTGLWLIRGTSALSLCIKGK